MDLTDCISLAEKQGFGGVAAWLSHHGYLAACLNAVTAKICDPRTWNECPTPEDAITALGTQLQRLEDTKTAPRASGAPF